VIRAIPDAKTIIVSAPNKIGGDRAKNMINFFRKEKIPILGRIPIDPRLGECADAGDPFLQKHPESEVAEACNLIIEKIMGGERK
jgi:ATP-binding protein involved in chromosome partitioning